MRYLSHNPEDGGSSNAEAAREEADYYQRIEEHFGQRRGGPLILSPKDWKLIQRWREKGIPLPIVLRGINRAFDRFAASGRRPDRVNTLGYCAQHIDTVWEEHRLAHAGSREARRERSGDKPVLAFRHLREVALACRRSISPDLAEEEARALERAAVELERLAQRAEDGELDAGSLDAAAKSLERCLDEALAKARGVEDVQTGRRADLQIPHFSPYAI